MTNKRMSCQTKYQFNCIVEYVCNYKRLEGVRRWKTCDLLLQQFKLFKDLFGT